MPATIAAAIMNAFIVFSLECGSGPHDYYAYAVMFRSRP
jgi:hypothetical protein